MLEEDYSTSKHPEAQTANHHLRLARRLQSIASNIRLLESGATDGRDRSEALKIITHTSQAIHQVKPPITQECSDRLKRAQQDNWHHRHTFAITIFATDHLKLYQHHKQLHLKDLAAEKEARLNHPTKGPKALTKALVETGTDPLAALKRPTEGPNGEPAGSWATNPAELDDLLKKAWCPIYQGNVPSGRDDYHIRHFHETYHTYIFTAPEHQINELSWEDLQQSCTQASKSASGLDDWAPADFSLLSDLAFQWLARILNLVEEGAPWPAGTLHAKASHLPKDTDNLADPMAYRILLILPAIYRPWASTRLKDIYPWVETWKNLSMFAGIPGMGALDGWYQTAIQVELCKLLGIPYTGGAADIFKCFDQIHRGLLYHLATVAGIPNRVLTAYRNYHDKVLAYNAVAGALGQPYTKPASIPQGCPLSMVLIALIMRPWTLIAQQAGAIPRTRLTTSF